MVTTTSRLGSSWFSADCIHSASCAGLHDLAREAEPGVGPDPGGMSALGTILPCARDPASWKEHLDHAPSRPPRIAVSRRPGPVRGAGAAGLSHPPVRVVIPFGPGGGTDNLARIIEIGVGRVLGQTLVIDTRPGGGGVIGTEVVARAEPDGQTILLVDSSFAIDPGLMPRLPYDPLRDFIPVCLLASGSTVLLVHPSLNVNTLQEFLVLARARPVTLDYASGGNGTSPHLAG